MAETLYQLKDLAQIFGVTTPAISNWRKRGSGPELPEPAYVTSSGKPLYTRSQIEAVIADQTAKARQVLESGVRA